MRRRVTQILLDHPGRCATAEHDSVGDARSEKGRLRRRALKAVLAAPEETMDGRSEYVWLRLTNGDLILGVFPRGDTYFEVEKDAQYPLPLKSKTAHGVGELLDKLEAIRNWLHEAPTQELEAVEDALGKNAPIAEINESINLVWLIHGTPSAGG